MLGPLPGLKVLDIEDEVSCYERDFMMFLSDDKQTEVVDAFYTTSRYVDDILSINNVYYDNMVSKLYPSKLQLNKK